MQTIYDGLARSFCYPDRCSCEAFWNGWVLQPVSVLTSFPDIFIGLWILRVARDLRLKLFGYSLVVVGTGSVMIHASYTRIGEIADFLGIALVSGWFLCLQLTARKPELFARAYWTLHAVSLATLLLGSEWKYPLVYSINALWVAWLLFAPRDSKAVLPTRGLALGIGTIALGFVLFQIDLKHLWCPETVWIQGHVLWHLLGAVGNGILFTQVFRPALEPSRANT